MRTLLTMGLEDTVPQLGHLKLQTEGIHLGKADDAKHTKKQEISECN